MHTLIVGMTDSGKSTLAKILARGIRDSGKQVLIVDPIGDPQWAEIAGLHDRVFDDIEDASEFLKHNQNMFVFVDESGEHFNDGNDLSYSWFATRSRHYGHSVTFIAQRAMQVPRLMRDQCSRIYLFTSSGADGEMLAKEWNKPELATCNMLPQFTFFKAGRYEPLQKFVIKDFVTIEPVVESAPKGGTRKRKEPQ